MIPPKTSVTHVLIAAAATVVVIAGCKAAAPLIVPFILSVFITLLLLPPLRWMIAKGVPKGVAFAVVIALVFFFFIGLSGLLTNHVADLIAHAKVWQQSINAHVVKWFDFLENHGMSVDRRAFYEIFQPDKLFAYTLSFVRNTSALLSNSLLIFFTVVFMLSESFVLEDKIRYIETRNGIEGLSERLKKFSEKLHYYFSLKALTSAVTGVWIMAVLYWFDIPYPVLWGLGGFMLNFVPVIGSIIAAIPPILLALATHGFSDALWVGGWFLVINITIGNVIEPRIMGKGLELSELVVFVSLVFWGWVFGKTGMLLAVPLTMVVKFALETSESTRWMAVMMSDRVKTGK